MRIVFMGSPDFAVPTLDALVGAGHDVIAAYCQPPRPAGRGKEQKATPVQRRAEALGIPVRMPASLKSAEEHAAFAALGGDVAVVAAYGLILPQPILDAPRLGCVNVHASLLPRWRGAAPVQRAIMAGDEVTGVTLMQMEAGLDTGPMLMSREVPIDRKNAVQLAQELGEMGAAMIVEWALKPEAYQPVPQAEHGVTYASKIDKSETRIDWNRPACELKHQVQGLAPYPGAWFEYAGERIRILEAGDAREENLPGTVMEKEGELLIACGQGSLFPVILQRAGRGAMGAREFLRGFPIPEGTILP